MPGQQTRQFILQNPPTADVAVEGDNTTFSLENNTLPELGKDQLLVKPLYLSNDPAQRGWIQKDVSAERMYLPPVRKGDLMRAFAVSEVLESTSSNIKKGDLVLGSTGWTEYAIMNAAEARPVQPDEKAGIKATHYLGALGSTGLTAYWGLVDVGRAAKSDVVVVSGAAGATGSMVVQIAKHLIGCKKVIGIAGGDKKCRWVESIGADVCLDYKSSSFAQDLEKATEGYVDLYFDNVGGEILDRMLTRIKRHGRVAVCGSISTYNGQDFVLKNWFEVIANRIEIKGLIVLDAMTSGRMGPIMEELTKGAKEGKIVLGDEVETVVKTKFEDIPKTWMMLFEGGEKGKQGKLVTDLTA